MAKYTIFLGDTGKSIYDQKTIINELAKNLKAAQSLMSICRASVEALIEAEVTIIGKAAEEENLPAGFEDYIIEEYDGVNNIIAKLKEEYADLFDESSSNKSEEIIKLSNDILELADKLDEYLNTDTSESYDNKTIMQWYLDQYQSAYDNWSDINEEIKSHKDNISSLSNSAKSGVVLNSNEVLKITNLSNSIREQLNTLAELISAKVETDGSSSSSTSNSSSTNNDGSSSSSGSNTYDESNMMEGE